MGCRFFGFDDRGIELPSGSREIPIRLRADGNGSSLPRESVLSARKRVLMSSQELGKESPVEGTDGISVIRGSDICRGWNGITYKTGMSARNVGSESLSMNVAQIPPGGVARAHIHVGFELMLYILQGHVRHDYGPGLKTSVENKAGDFIFIAPGVPHEVFNMSETEPVVAVVARSDAREWENIVEYDRDREG